MKRQFNNNFKGSQMKQTTIIQTCIGGVFSLDLVRAMQLDPDLNLRIIGVDGNPNIENRFFLDQFYPVPLAKTEPEHYISCMLELCRKEDVQYILAGSDEEAYELSKYKTQFSDNGVECIVEQTETIELIRNKWKVLDVLAQQDIVVPKVYDLGKPFSLKQIAEELGYPDHKFIIKPKEGRGSRGFMIVDAQINRFQYLNESRGSGLGNMDAVNEKLNAMDSTQSLMAMEYLPGEMYDVDCLAKEGSPICVLPRKREWDDPYSPSNQGCRIEKNAEMINTIETVCRALQINYIVDMDCGTGYDGKPKIFEINPRMSGSIASSLAAGINLPAVLIRRLLGMPIPNLTFESGGRMIPKIRMEFC